MPLSLYRSKIFAVAELRSTSDVDRSLKLLDDYAALAEQLSETMAGQRKRGIRLPAWAVPAAVATVRGHAEASAELAVAPGRLTGLAPGLAGGLAGSVARLVQGRLAAGWRRLVADPATHPRRAGPGGRLAQ